MHVSRRLLTALLAVAVFLAFPSVALATERGDRGGGDTVVVDTEETDTTETDRPVRDRPADKRPTDEVDRPQRDVTDRRPDIDDHRRCLRLADNPRRCIDVDLGDPINIRHLIWRLINAHEWKLLIRLFHALGWL